MGKKNTSKYDTIKIGDSFASWTVIGNPFLDRYAKVPCRCECGVEHDVDAYTLTVGKSKSCIHCFNRNRFGAKNNSWKGYEEIPKSWFYRFEQYAVKKNNIFDITIEFVWSLYIKQNRRCALTDIPINFENACEAGNRWKGLVCTASLDRIDSKQGYVIGNVQLVHKDINIMKNHFNQDYFIEMCKAVAANNI
jgi:hypothetical protein